MHNLLHPETTQNSTILQTLERLRKSNLFYKAQMLLANSSVNGGSFEAKFASKFNEQTHTTTDLFDLLREILSAGDREGSDLFTEPWKEALRMYDCKVSIPSEEDKGNFVIIQRGGYTIFFLEERSRLPIKPVSMFVIKGVEDRIDGILEDFGAVDDKRKYVNALWESVDDRNIADFSRV